MHSQDIETRIQSLESRLNRYRSISIGLALALVGLAGIAANAPGGAVTPEVRAHKVVIVDDKGKEVGHLATGPHGGILNLSNNDGIPVVRMGASDKGGKIALADVKGDPYLQLSSEETGGEVSVTDKKGAKNLLRPTAAAK